MRRKQSKIVHWEQGYADNKRKFDELMAFLRGNTSIVQEHRMRSVIKRVGSVAFAREKLYFLFLDTLNAAGGSSLARNGQACRDMIRCLQELPATSTVSFSEFCRAVVPKKMFFDDDKRQASKELFKSLSRGLFMNLRFKKAAVLMKELADSQADSTCRIFNDIEVSDIYLPIPLDVVISQVISQVLGFQYNNAYRVVAPVDGQAFTEWVEMILEKEYYLMEDLWFWGYFGLGKPEVGRYREIGLNEAKFSTCPWVFPPILDPIRGKVEEFCGILKSKT